MNWLKIDRYLTSFLEEDISWIDITSEALSSDVVLKGVIKTKEDGVLAGGIFAKRVFELLGISNVILKAQDGDNIKKGDIILETIGPVKSILMGERVALNILQSLSGIATKTKTMADMISDYGVKILDTRKTTPGYRFFEKYAVRMGSGKNHRFALYDMVLIKDNHIKAYGSISNAVNKIAENLSMAYKIELEVENFEQIKEALTLPIDIILLDNFSPEDAKKAVKMIRDASSYVKVEISGEINEQNLIQYAKARPDFISSGAIIHSSKWLNMSMDLKPIF